LSERTWQRMYAPWLRRLIVKAGERNWASDEALLVATLTESVPDGKRWEPNSRARQMVHDRIRRLWKQAGWEWPAEVAELRGNGKAAKAPGGVRGFSDAELAELRARIERSIQRHKLTPADLVAWDCLAVFGLRPAELQGLAIAIQQGVPVAKVSREKRSNRGSGGVRQVPAVPPAHWPGDCFELAKRFEQYGLPPALVAYWSPGEKMAQQLARLQIQQAISCDLDPALTPFGCRHAFALRLAQQVGLHVREAAELMGHSPAVHLSTYGRRLDSPKLISAVIGKVKANQAQL
jgi:integrase